MLARARVLRKDQCDHDVAARLALQCHATSDTCEAQRTDRCRRSLAAKDTSSEAAQCAQRLRSLGFARTVAARSLRRCVADASPDPFSARQQNLMRRDMQAWLPHTAPPLPYSPRCCRRARCLALVRCASGETCEHAARTAARRRGGRGAAQRQRGQRARSGGENGAAHPAGGRRTQGRADAAHDARAGAVRACARGRGGGAAGRLAGRRVAAARAELRAHPSPGRLAHRPAHASVAGGGVARRRGCAVAVAALPWHPACSMARWLAFHADAGGARVLLRGA